jgi:hypothetical protein
MLAEQGLLAAKGEKRGRFYVASDWLGEARASVRATKVVTDLFTGARVQTAPAPFRGSPR